MALSGTVNGSVTNKSNYFSFYFTWSATQSISGNYSDVTVKTYWKTNNTYQTFDTVGNRNASITINGTKTSISKVFECYWSSNPYLIQTATTRVYHKDDGSKSITISARANGYALSYGPSASEASSSDCTASTTVALTTIPRASTISSISNDKMVVNGSNKITVNISRASSAFTHKVTWTFGEHSYSYSNQGTSNSFPVPLSWIDTFGDGGSGTKSGSVSVQTYNGSTAIGSAVSKTFTLTCPRASTISESTASITCNGSNKIEVSISRIVSSFTHTVKWEFNSNSKSTSDVGTSTTYAPPTSWLSSIPTATSGTGKVYVTTYYGSQKIGATTSRSFTLKVPSYTPTIGSVGKAIVQDSRISNWSIYVQNYSKVKFTFSGSAGEYGSTIKQYDITIDGVSYSKTSSTITSNILTGKGTLNYTAKITDSRNKSKSVTGSISVSEMIKPAFTSATIYRYNGSAKADEGTQLYFKFNFTFEDYDGLNSTTNQIFYRSIASKTFTEYGKSFTNGTALIINDVTFNIDKAYEIKVVVTDKLGNSIQYSTTIETASVLIDVDGESPSVGLLKMTSRAGYVEVGGKLAIDDYIENPQGSLAHYFYSTGTVGYIKFATITITSTNADNSVIFELNHRNKILPSKVAIQFASSSSSNDPGLESIVVTNNNIGIYAVKVATSTWDLYYQDDTGWDRVCLYNLAYAQKRNSHSIAWTMEEVTSLPSEAVQASYIYYNDTGWVDCTIASGFKRYSTSQYYPTLQVRKINGVVHLRGMVSPTAAITPSGLTTSLGTLPSGYAPTMIETVICQGGGANRFLLQIHPNRSLYIARYSDSTTTNEEIASGAWLNCYATWMHG